MARLDRNSVLVSGVVATLQIVVSSGDYQEDSRNDKVYGMARELQQLRHDIEEQVLNTLGEEFEVSYFDIRPGSAHLIIGIATAAFELRWVLALQELCRECSSSTFRSRPSSKDFRTDSIDDDGLNVRTIWSPGPSIVMRLGRPSARTADSTTTRSCCLPNR